MTLTASSSAPHFQDLMEPIASRLLGEPNQRLSKPPKEGRWGTHGSLSVNFQAGTFFDHEAGVGGGVLDLIKHKTGCDQGGALDWLRREGFLPPRESLKQAEPKSPRFVCAYNYCDANGVLIHQTVRYDPKTFRQRRPNPETNDWIWNLDGVQPVLYRLRDVLTAVAAGRRIFICEGEKDADSVAALGLVATTNVGGAKKWRAEYNETLRDAHVVLLPHNDDPGRAHVGQVAAALNGVAASIRVLDIAEHWPDCSPKSDISDWLAAGGTAEKLKALVGGLPSFEGFDGPQRLTVSDFQWSEPKPLPTKLPKVAQFDVEFLPPSIAPWVADISERLQCPMDYPAVTAIVALGSLIGRRVGIKPQQKTDWTEVPNVWGAFIGKPGLLKSPAMMEALKPVHQLEAEAAKAHAQALIDHQNNLAGFKLNKSVAESVLKEALKKKVSEKVVNLDSVASIKEAIKEAQGEDPLGLGAGPEEPKPVRYRTNDSSYESLGELLVSNPTGLLVERDELVSLLKHLDREEQCVARGFYLSGWSGQQPYTFDRIGRGHIHVDAVCIEVLGNTQPARIAEYIRYANADGAGGDGLIQRFGLLVWPDEPADWKNVDEWPNAESRDAVWRIFERISKLTEAEALKLGALKGQYDKIPFFRFDEEAAAEFLNWRCDLERRLRSDELSPALEGHLAKYRKLVPALALIDHLAEGGMGSVGAEALARALDMAEYLETHARRVYGATDTVDVIAAEAILTHIRRGDLKDGFTARDVHQRDWSRLTDRDHVQRGLDLLVDLDHLAADVSGGKPGSRGRPKVTYRINPASKR
jgi:putative DNA primase/helicase